MRIYEVTFKNGDNVIMFAATRWAVWRKYPPYTIANINRIVIT